MYEIELKAHIYNREETIKILNTFAKYIGFFQKHDSYYKLQKQNSNDFISVRIRKELSKQEQNISEKIYLTYKQKELKNTSDGTKIEVNNEKECELSNSETVISFLLDTGFCEYLSKSKTVEKFSYQTPSGIATIEICTIPPIGDFIEIEIFCVPSDKISPSSRVFSSIERLLQNVPLDWLKFFKIHKLFSKRIEACSLET